MNIIWQVDADDIAKVKEFFDLHRDNAFVKMRIATNLKDDKPSVTKEQFWEVMIACLLTTQQRSGPGSAVTRFIATSPCLLRHELCREQVDLDVFVTKVLGEFGGLRRSTTIGREAKANWTAAGRRPWKSSNECGSTPARRRSGMPPGSLTRTSAGSAPNSRGTCCKGWD